MIGKCLCVTILVAACAVPAAAQSYGALLEQGIYAEETVGDLQAARQFYENLLRMPGVPRDIALIAERRLNGVRRRLEPASASVPATIWGRARLVIDPATEGMFSHNYDPARPVIVRGTVARVEWSNPLMVVYLHDSSGGVWGFTLGSPNTMVRRGWTKDAFRLGDELVVEGFLALGTDDICPGPLPNTCAQLTGGATHATANIIRTSNGETLFDRNAPPTALSPPGAAPR